MFSTWTISTAGLSLVAIQSSFLRSPSRAGLDCSVVLLG